MHTMTIKYKDHDGDDQEEKFYFNINEVEMIDLEVKHDEGLYHWLDKLVKMEDRRAMWEEFKYIVLLSYGSKTPDGKSFMKKDPATGTPLSAAFEYHAAFNQLMKELTTDENVAANFINKVLPAEMIAAAEKAAAEEKQKAEEEAAKTASTEQPEAPTT